LPTAAVERVAWLDGACVLVRSAALDAVGGLDERYFLYWEDIDTSLRLARRGPLLVARDAAGRQAPSASQPLYLMQRNRLLIWRQHRRWLAFAISAAEVAAAVIKRLLRPSRASLLEARTLVRALRDGLAGVSGPDRGLNR
jgi:GT2 family glycosyltransferase